MTNARTALQCIAQVEVLSTDAAVGQSNNLQIMPFGLPPGHPLVLRKPDRSPFAQLEITIDYQVREVASTRRRPSYQAFLTMYMYAVSDLSGRELFAYHWHPTGVSAIRTPHFHASSTPPLILPGRPGNSDTSALVLSRVHFPTHHIELPEFVRFLITEIGVGPRRSDWDSVLARIER